MEQLFLERPMNLPEIPPVVEDQEQQKETDYEWVQNVTKSIESELKRASLSKTSWEERRLIWQARSVVHAERAIQSGEKYNVQVISESVIGAAEDESRMGVL